MPYPVSLLQEFDSTVGGAQLLLSATLQAVVCVVLAMIAAAWLRRRSTPSLRHVVWVSALLALLIAPLIGTLTGSSGLELSLDDSAGPSAAQADPDQPALSGVDELPPPIHTWSPSIDADSETVTAAEPDDTSVTEASLAPAALPRQSAPRSEQTSNRAGTLTWLNRLAVIWLVGAAALLVLVGVTNVYLATRQRTYQTVNNPRLLAAADGVANELQLTRRVQLMQSDSKQMPMTWGVFRSVLVLPSTAADWSDDRLRMVLLHELAHVQRLDCLWRIVSLLGLAYQWFNPFVWRAAARLREESERACDDAVLRAGASPSGYAELLLELGTDGKRGVGALCAGLAMARSQRLSERVQTVLDGGRVAQHAPRTAMFLAVMIAVGLMISVGALGNVTINTDAGGDEPTSSADAAASDSGATAGEGAQQQRRLANSEAVQPQGRAIADPEALVRTLLPLFETRYDSDGMPASVVTPDGEITDLATFRQPGPAEVGYWASPAMNAVAAALEKVSSTTEAENAVAALHMITEGVSFVRQKLYRALRVDRGWIVLTEHDFEKYLAMVRYEPPYEIEVDESGRVERIRQRNMESNGNIATYRAVIARRLELQRSVTGGMNYFHDAVNEELWLANARDEGREPGYNSRRAYPNAVISVRDDSTGQQYIVNHHGSKIFVRNADDVVVQILHATGLIDLSQVIGTPVIRHLALDGNQLVVTIGKKTVVQFDRDNFEAELINAARAD